MGNLEKVLIVIILATIAVITALAFLDSGDGLTTDLRDERSSATGGAASAFDRAVREAEDRARAERDESAGAADPDEEDSELENFFRERSGSNDGAAESAGEDPETEGSDSTRDPASVSGGRDSGTGSAAASNGEDEGSLESGSDTGSSTESPDPVGLRMDSDGGRNDSPSTRQNPSPNGDILRSERGYVLGSRRYTTVEGDTWDTIADIVYGDPELAWAVREANTDVRGETLAGGVALFIVPHEEIDRSRAPSRTKPGNEGSTRIHVVEKDETLSGISRQYYGRETRWKEIFEANRDQLATERDLRPGMKIRIP